MLVLGFVLGLGLVLGLGVWLELGYRKIQVKVCEVTQSYMGHIPKPVYLGVSRRKSSFSSVNGFDTKMINSMSMKLNILQCAMN